MEVIFVLVRLPDLKNALQKHATWKRANGSANGVLKDFTVPQRPCLLLTKNVHIELTGSKEKMFPASYCELRVKYQ